MVRVLTGILVRNSPGDNRSGRCGMLTTGRAAIVAAVEAVVLLPGRRSFLATMPALFDDGRGARLCLVAVALTPNPLEFLQHLRIAGPLFLDELPQLGILR